MFNRSICVWTIALASAVTFAGPLKTESYPITVPTGQGAPITITVRVDSAPSESPYALTGDQAGRSDLQSVQMRFGQSGLIWVAK